MHIYILARSLKKVYAICQERSNPLPLYFPLTWIEIDRKFIYVFMLTNGRHHPSHTQVDKCHFKASLNYPLKLFPKNLYTLIVKALIFNYS